MNLHENIYRIKTLMVEDKSILNMIKTLGITDAIKYLGGINKVMPYITREDKVIYVKDKLSEIIDDEQGGFGVGEVDGLPIFYNENDYEIRQVEYLNKYLVYVDVYDKVNHNHLGEFKVHYEKLPPSVLDDIFNLLIEL